jgi:HSP20 family molecular chaperone IbpA
LLLGFDHLERMLDNVSKASAEGYPPYNIEQLSSNEIRITLAVAGFTENDLDVVVEGNELIVRGRQAEDDGERVFLHRGIAARQFQRRFVVAEGIEVESASLEHGLLQIHLVRPEPVVRSRSIAIKTGGAGRTNGRTVSV